MAMIFHLTTPELWQQAQTLGEFRADSLETEGFIHASTLAQVIAIANAFYASERSLLLLGIEGDRLRAEIRWEPPAPPASAVQIPEQIPESELFPHIYGAIDLDAVEIAIALPKDSQGRYCLPESLLKIQ